MPRVLPFTGLRFDPARVADPAATLCPPYDVISPAERADLARRSPYNAVHVELPADDDGQPGSRYAAAARTLQAWQAEGALRQDPHPAYYLLETRFSHGGTERTRRDLIAAVAADPWGPEHLLPHEHTFAGPKADRLALLHATHANLSPIWMLHREQPPALAAAWDTVANRARALEAEHGGARHRLWVLDEPGALEAISAAFAAGGPLYIADGHHRYETALRFREETGASVPGADAVLALLTWADDPGLLVLPTHRVLRGLPEHLTAEELETRWATHFHAEYFPVWDEAPPEQVDALLRQLESQGQLGPAFGVLGPGPDTFALLEVRGYAPPPDSMPADRSEAWRRLDVAVLHTLLVDPLVAEVGRPREEVLAYTRDPREAFAAVRAAPDSLAFFLNATRVPQVLDVADAGDRMPEKSTYFFPKPPTGLVLRSLRTP